MEGGMIPLPHGMIDPRRGMPYHDGHCEEAYRGDPRGIYGGFRHDSGAAGTVIFPEIRGSVPHYHNLMDHPYHEHQHATGLRASRSLTTEPQQLHLPRAPHGSVEPATQVGPSGNLHE